MPVKELNKSDEVRKLYKSGVKLAPQIVAKLKARNIDVAPSQVYQVIAKQKGKKSKARQSQPASHPQNNETVIDHAVVFVRSAGGMSKARELLSKLALLRD